MASSARIFQRKEAGYIRYSIIMQPTRFSIDHTFTPPIFASLSLNQPSTGKSFLLQPFPPGNLDPTSGCLRSRLDDAIFGNAYLGQKRLGPRQFGGSKIAFIEIQGVAPQRSQSLTKNIVGWMKNMGIFFGGFFFLAPWNWGDGEVLLIF